MILRSRDIILLFIITIVFFALNNAYAAEQAPISSTKVRSDDGKHKVIKEACSVCHKEEEFEFLIMIYSTKKIAPKGGKPETASKDQPDMVFAPSPTGAKNFHQGINCLFCHQREESGEPSKDKFITLDGRLSSLCTLCHTNMKDLHFLIKGRFQADELTALLKSYGLSFNSDGSASCVTCHTVHSDEVFGTSIKEAFKPFLKDSSYYNPHGSAISCIACHATVPKPKEKVSFIDDDLESICRKCHIDDIKKHHITEVRSSRETYIMDFLELPLRDEAIYCSTCHDETCYKKTDPLNKKFLINGPYKNEEEFCSTCHRRGVDKSTNPHKQIDPKGNIIKMSCALCHEKFPEQGEEDIMLLLPVNDMCAACHKIYDHPDTQHLVELQGEKLENLLSYQEVFKINFPLNDKGEITCATCHNPHDKGVLSGLPGVGAGEYMKLRGVSFEEACMPCHGKVY